MGPSLPSKGAAQPHALLMLCEHHFTWLGLLAFGKCTISTVTLCCAASCAVDSTPPAPFHPVCIFFFRSFSKGAAAFLTVVGTWSDEGDTLILCSCLLFCCSHLCRTDLCCAISSSRNPGTALQGLRSSQPSPVVAAAPTQACAMQKGESSSSLISHNSQESPASSSIGKGEGLRLDQAVWVVWQWQQCGSTWQRSWLLSVTAAVGA